MKVFIETDEVQEAWKEIVDLLADYCEADFPAKSVFIIKKVLFEQGA